MVSSKASSPATDIYCILCQSPVRSLFLKVMQKLVKSSSPSSRPFYHYWALFARNLTDLLLHQYVTLRCDKPINICASTNFRRLEVLLPLLTAFIRAHSFRERNTADRVMAVVL